MIDLVSKRFLFLIASTLIIIPGLIATFAGGIKPGIDFTGGTRITVKPLNEQAYDVDRFKATLTDAGYGESLVKSGSIGEGAIVTNTITMDIPRISALPQAQLETERAKIEGALIEAGLVRGQTITETIQTRPAAPTPGATITGTATITVTSPITSASNVTGTNATTSTTGTSAAGTTTQTTTRQITRIPDSEIIDDTNIGPTVGGELLIRAFQAIGAASLAILLYLTLVFRKVPNAFRYGVCAIFALLHDVLVVIGVFAILGLLFGVEIDALFVTAMLTVIGFSVHDTIVVFDRVRENILRRRFERFEDVVNYSLVQTLARSINTSITVILTLFALYLFGGESIRNFVLALLIGIISGTYSSIFNASMLLVIWEKGEWRRLFGGRSQSAPASTRGATAR